MAHILAVNARQESFNCNT